MNRAEEAGLVAAQTEGMRRRQRGKGSRSHTHTHTQTSSLPLLSIVDGALTIGHSALCVCVCVRVSFVLRLYSSSADGVASLLHPLHSLLLSFSLLL